MQQVIDGLHDLCQVQLARMLEINGMTTYISFDLQGTQRGARNQESWWSGSGSGPDFPGFKV
jgi:hypothetical protein